MNRERPQHPPVKTLNDFAHYCMQYREALPTSSAWDLMFIWEVEAQKQCDEYNMSMYHRMEIIAKAFNSYL